MKSLYRKIAKIMRSRGTRRLLKKTVSCIAAIVVFVTTYALILPAITLEKNADCGIEEHQHDQSCYEEVLVCSQEEGDDHHHTDECYEKVLVCGKEEHIHSVKCYHDKDDHIEEAEEASAYAAETDQENAGSVFDSAEGDTMSGGAAEDTVSEEAEGEYVPEDAEADSAFEAAEEDTMSGGAEEDIASEETNGDTMPEESEGDIVSEETDGDTMPEESGENSSPEAVDGDIMPDELDELDGSNAPEAVEEYTDTVVAEAGDDQIQSDDGGTASDQGDPARQDDDQVNQDQNQEDVAETAENAAETTDNAAETAEDPADGLKNSKDAAVNPAAETENSAKTKADRAADDDKKAEKHAFKAGTLSAHGDGYRIIVDYSAEAKIPENASLSVREIAPETSREVYEECLAQAKQHVKDSHQAGTGVDTNATRFFDMEILDSDGNRMEPAAPVKVIIRLSEIPSTDAEKDLAARADQSAGETQNTNIQQAAPTVLHFADRGVEEIQSATYEKTAEEIAASEREESKEKASEKAQPEDLTNSEAAGQEAAGQEAADEEAVDEEASDEEAAAQEATDKETVDEEASDEEAADKNGREDAASGNTWAETGAENFEAEESFNSNGTEAGAEIFEAEEFFNSNGLEAGAENFEAEELFNSNGTEAGTESIVAEETIESGQITREVQFQAESFSIYGVVYTIDAYYVTAAGETYEISVTYGGDAGLPDDLSLVVHEILEDDDRYADYLAASAQEISCDESRISYARIFDISLADSAGAVWEPAAGSQVHVSMELRDLEADDRPQVIHFGGQPRVMETTADGAKVEFDTDSFSVYSVVTVEEKSLVTNPVTDLQENMPYFLQIKTSYVTNVANTSTSPQSINRNTQYTQAAPYYFEAYNNAEQGQYYLYTYDASNAKKYLHFEALNAGDGHLLMGDEASRGIFTVTAYDSAQGLYGISGTAALESTTYTYYINLHAANKVAGWRDGPTSDEGSRVRIFTVDETDPLLLDGKDYIIVNADQWAVSATAKNSNNRFQGLDVVEVSKDELTGTYTTVAAGAEVPVWHFDAQEDGTYYISTTAGGAKKYLHIAGVDSGGAHVTLADTGQELSVTLHGGKIAIADAAHPKSRLDRFAGQGNVFSSWAEGNNPNSNELFTLGQIIDGSVIYVCQPYSGTYPEGQEQAGDVTWTLPDPAILPWTGTNDTLAAPQTTGSLYEKDGSYYYEAENENYDWVYRFKGWKLSGASGDTLYQPGTQINEQPDPTVTYLAQWEFVEKKETPYTVRYVLNLPSGTTVTPKVIGLTTAADGAATETDLHGNWARYYDVRNLDIPYYKTSESQDDVWEFMGWKTETNSTVNAGETVSLHDTHYDAVPKDYVITLTAQWSRTYKETAASGGARNREVRFYISKHATSADIFNPNPDISVNASDFTDIVYTTLMLPGDRAPEIHEGSSWTNLVSYDYLSDSEVDTQDQPFTTDSMTEANDQIRLLGSTGLEDSTVYSQEEGASTVFRTLSFPTDEEIFAQLKEGHGDDEPIPGVTIDGVSILARDLNHDNYTIRWYVCKYQGSSAWHIDGKLVPNINYVTITKTFDGDEDAVSSILSRAANATGYGGTPPTGQDAPFYITLTNQSDPDNIYYLYLVDKTNDQANRRLYMDNDRKVMEFGYVEKEGDTCKWSIPVSAASHYNVTEHNYMPAVSTDQGAVNYLLSAQYSVTNSDGNTPAVPLTQWFSTVGSHSASYPVDLIDVDHMLTTNLYNTYIKKDTFVIQKRDASGTYAAMPGVHFNAYQVNANGTHTRLKIERAEGTTQDDGMYSVKTENGTATDYAMTGTDGNIYLTLPRPATGTSTFYIEERVPDGYKTGEHTPSFKATIDSEGNFTVSDLTIDSGCGSITELKTGTMGTADNSNAGVVTGVTVMNEPIRILRVTVTKSWDGCSPEESVTMRLTGKTDGETRVQYDQVLDGSNGWSHNWEELPLVIGNETVRWNVEEIKINDYASGTDAFRHWVPMYMIPVYKDAEGNVLQNDGTDVAAEDMYKVQSIDFQVTNAVMKENVVNVLLKKVSSADPNTVLTDAEFNIYEKIHDGERTEDDIAAGYKEIPYKDGDTIQTYTVKDEGYIRSENYTIRYERGKTFFLEETRSPTGYIRKEGLIRMDVALDGAVKVDSELPQGYVALGPHDTRPGNPLYFNLTVKNVPMTLRIKKVQVDAATPIPGATFALYKAEGGTRALFPMEGYENLVTNADGYITKDDSIVVSLEDGIYHLMETSVPTIYDDEGHEAAIQYSILRNPTEITVTGTGLTVLHNGHRLLADVDDDAANPVVTKDQDGVETGWEYRFKLRNLRSEYVCKLTKEIGGVKKQLYYNSAAENVEPLYTPAAYRMLKDGFHYATQQDSEYKLYYKDEDGSFVEVTGNDRKTLNIEMLVQEYTEGLPIIADADYLGQSDYNITFMTTPDTEDEENHLFYQGEEGTQASIDRSFDAGTGTYSNASMITAGIQNLTIKNVTLNGGYNEAAGSASHTADHGSLLEITAGQVTLDDGALLEYGHAEQGGAVYIDSNGRLTVNDGATLKDNVSLTSGGAVYVAEGGTLDMTGGIMEENSAVNGSAVYLAADATTIMNMSGGTITGNTVSGPSGAVEIEVDATGDSHVNGSVIFSGQPVIQNNHSTDPDAVTNNLYCVGGTTNAIRTAGTGLEAGSHIGVYFSDGTEAETGNKKGDRFGTADSGATSGLEYFHNDTYGYLGSLRGDNQIVWADESYQLTITKTVAEGGAENGSTENGGTGDSGSASDTFTVTISSPVITKTSYDVTAVENYTVNGTPPTTVSATPASDSAPGTIELTGVAHGTIITITGLPHGTYTVTEAACSYSPTFAAAVTGSDSPAGNVPTTSVTSGSGSGVRFDLTENTTVAITNSMTSKHVKVRTTAGDNTTTPLAGVGFVLENENGEAIQGSESTPLVTDSDGFIDLGNLSAGDYYLRPVDTPGGYTMPENRIKITVNPADSLPVTAVSDTATNPANYTVDGPDAGQAYTVNIPISTGYELPATGGPGTGIFHVLGAVLILGAGLSRILRCVEKAAEGEA